jgi:hypothetical protein
MSATAAEMLVPPMTSDILSRKSMALSKIDLAPLGTSTSVNVIHYVYQANQTTVRVPNWESQDGVVMHCS